MKASIRDYMESERELRTFLNESGLSEDSEIMAVEQKAFDASQAFTQTRKNHPQLKELYAVNDALKGDMIDAKLKGDEETYQAKMSEYTSLRMQLEKTSKNLPEIQAAQAELQVVLDEQNELIARKVEAVNSDGKKIAKRYRELHEQFKNKR